MVQSSETVRAIVEAVAECEDVRPEILPRPAEWLDPETFRELTAFRTDRTDPLQFTYLWYRITVHSPGEITVRP